MREQQQQQHSSSNEAICICCRRFSCYKRRNKSKTNHGLYGLLYGGDYGKVVAFHVLSPAIEVSEAQSPLPAYVMPMLLLSLVLQSLLLRTTPEHKMWSILFLLHLQLLLLLMLLGHKELRLVFKNYFVWPFNKHCSAFNEIQRERWKVIGKDKSRGNAVTSVVEKIYILKIEVTKIETRGIWLSYTKKKGKLKIISRSNSYF